MHKASGVTWKEAADAAYDMIEYADGGDFYRLYEDPTTPEKSYTRLFNTPGSESSLNSLAIQRTVVSNDSRLISS